MTAEDWATVASLATAVGTLVLAVATFSAVRSGNRSARVAERSLLIGLRPVLMASHREDAPLKVNFGDSKWLRVPGACGVAEIGGGDGSLGPAAKDDVIYLAMSMRNVGNGIAVLHGWHFYEERPDVDAHVALDDFRPHTRDLYLPVSEPGFWQGAFRDTADRQYAAARRVIADRQEWYLDLLYGDQDGGQRVITRFRLQPFGEDTPGGDTKVWMAGVSRHWNLDRPDPRLPDRAGPADLTTVFADRLAARPGKRDKGHWTWHSPVDLTNFLSHTAKLAAHVTRQCTIHMWTAGPAPVGGRRLCSAFRPSQPS